MDSLHLRAAFSKLQPLCEIFLNTPSKDVLASLVKECKELNPQILQEMLAYILSPFTIHLRNTAIKSSNLRIAMVDAMNEIISRTQINTIDVYYKYFSLMIYLIFDKDSLETGKSVIDEDFTLSVVKVITTLTLKVPNNLRPKLYTRANATKIGRGIFVCIQLARKERYRALRLAAINCVMAMCTLHDDLMNDLHTPKISTLYGECVGDVLMFFLPGLLGAMQEIAKGEQKQGHMITCLAIKAISRVLCLTLMDEQENDRNKISTADFVKLVESHKLSKSVADEKPDPFGIKLRAKGAEGVREHLETAKRNRDWYDAAGEKLIDLMKSLFPVQYHPHSRVRKEAASMCLDIITYCPRNMYPSMKYVLEMLIALSEDDNAEIVMISKKALENFTTNELTTNRKRLLDILENNYNAMLVKLPRYLNKLDENLQLCGINLLKGYLRLMTDPYSRPQRLSQILSCTFIMNRFAIVLVEVFKLDTRNIKLFEECTIRNIETPASDACPWKNYTHLQNEMCVNSALEICRILGASDCCEVVVDYLLEQYRSDTEFKKEIIYILNEILSAPNGDIVKSEHLIKHVITNYIEYENWYLPIVVSAKENPLSKNDTYDVTVYNPREWVTERTPGLYEGATDIRYTDVSYRGPDNDDDDDDFLEINKDYCDTISQAQNNIIMICLMTEGIGKMAKHLKDNFQPFLLKTLYLILERAGSSIETIHLAGMKALADIADAMKLNSISDLIKTNADYFTHHVNMKLKKVTDNAGVLDVLLVVMKHSETEVLPCLYDIVNNVLDQCSKPYPQKNIILFLKLFYTFIKYISSKFPFNDEKKKKRNNSGNDMRYQTVLFVLKEYKKNLEIVRDIGEDPAIDGEIPYHPADSDDDNEGGEKKEPPTHVMMVVHVLKKTINFLPSNERDQKLLALDVVNEGIILVKDYEDELLPLVHQIWHPLVNRFKESTEHLIFNRAFKLLMTLAQVSKDFIRRRTLNEVMPWICKFLVKSSKDSIMKDVGSAYRLSQGYKLQLNLLSNLGRLVTLLDLQEKNIYDILLSTQRYLSCKQPKPLQLACIDLFKAICCHDIGAFWLHMNGLWHDGQYNQTIEKLKHFHFKEYKCILDDAPESADYKHNVCILLDFLRHIKK